MFVGVHSNCHKLSESSTLDRLEPAGNISEYIVTLSPSTSLVENVIEFVSNTVHCPIIDPVPFTEMKGTLFAATTNNVTARNDISTHKN